MIFVNQTGSRLSRCVALLVLLLAIAAGLIAVPGARATTVLADGHVDYAARMVDGQLRSLIKDGTQGADQVVWREPASVLYELRPASKATIPSDPRLAFLGPAGSPVWMIPQVQQAGILWAGWNTEELTSADVAGPVAWTLQSVQGPGRVSVFQTGSFGDPSVIFNSADGLPDRYDIPLGVHAHAAWAFSAPGTYQLTFQMASTRPSGEPMSDTQTLTVQVDDDPAVQQPGQNPPSTGGNQTGTGTTPTQPVGTGSQGGSGGTSKPTAKLAVRATHPRLAGRRLTVTLQLNRTSRVDVAVTRAGRTVTRAKARTVKGATKARTLRLQLGRTLPAGKTYKLTIRARAGATTVKRTLTLRTPHHGR